MYLAHLPPVPLSTGVAVCVLIAAGTDLSARRIPNWLVGAGALAALAVQIWLSSPLAGAMSWLSGLAVGFGMILPFYLLRGMAAGDIKLMAMVGAWVGPRLAFDIALATFLLGAVWSLILVLESGRLRQLLVNLQLIIAARKFARPMSEDKMTQEVGIPQSVGSIPYGVAIAAATIGVLFFAAR